MMPQDQQKKPVIPEEPPPRDADARDIAKEYADDQRAIIRKLRKLN
jgi:hypothetical protein